MGWSEARSGASTRLLDARVRERLTSRASRSNVSSVLKRSGPLLHARASLRQGTRRPAPSRRRPRASTSPTNPTDSAIKNFAGVFSRWFFNWSLIPKIVSNVQFDSLLDKHCSAWRFEDAPEGFQGGGLNQTRNPFTRGGVEPWNPKGFQVWLKPPVNPPLNQTWNPFGFQTGGFKPNPKPFRVSNGGVYVNQTWNPVGFQRGGLNQTPNPFGFQTGGFKPNPKPFRISNKRFHGGVSTQLEILYGFTRGI